MIIPCSSILLKYLFSTLLLYVDDIIFVVNDKEEIDRVKKALNKTFKINYIGDLRYFSWF